MIKIFTLITIFVLMNETALAQKGGTREIYTWTINNGAEFRLKSVGSIWGHDFELTNSYCGSTLVDTTITVPSNYSSYSYGWDNVVLNCSPTNAPPYFGYALYEVIIDDGRFSFYFDTRDVDYDGSYPCGNDFYFKYNFVQNSLIIETEGTCDKKTNI